MSEINETVVTGRKFRKLLDKTTHLWQRISFWTSASDVEFSDGSVLENRFGALTNHVNAIKSNVDTITEKTGGYKICVLTLAQYNALAAKDPNTLYFCT